MHYWILPLWGNARSNPVVPILFVLTVGSRYRRICPDRKALACIILSFAPSTLQYEAVNKVEAKVILSDHLSRYRSCSYQDLLRLLHEQDIVEFTAPSGKRYQLEFYAFWDDEPNGNLRVMGNIDDGGIRAFSPLNDDFILSPEGKFVDE